MIDPGRKQLMETVDAYLEDRKKFAVGFARFVLERGMETKAPRAEGRREERWIDVGRRIYGATLFDNTLRAELAERRKDRAKK